MTPTIEAETIGLLRLSAFGDTIHALPLVHGLRRLYPDAHLSWILEPLPFEIVREQPEVDRFVVVPPAQGLRAWTDLRRTLSDVRFDILLIPQVSMRASLLSLAARARTRLGFDRGRSRELHWLFVNEHLSPGPPRHAQDLFLEFLEYLGGGGIEPEWNLRFTRDELERSGRFFASIGRPALGLVIASSAPEKDWTPAGYAEVADAADRDLGLQPMLIGGPSARERKIADEILSRMSSKPVVALDAPVRETLLKLKGSRVIVAPDTGPLHAAVAMKRPTIGLYGFTNPGRCGPYRRFRDLLIDKYSSPGEHAEISRETRSGRMERIQPEEVLVKIAMALERYGGGAESDRGAE
jgi:heptosyltransferase I